MTREHLQDQLDNCRVGNLDYYRRLKLIEEAAGHGSDGDGTELANHIRAMRAENAKLRDMIHEYVAAQTCNVPPERVQKAWEAFRNA